MQWIVDNLFVGNKLATAEIVTGDGVRIDLRNITSPIICFCSQGDDITPPQQALGWILDLYGSVDDIRANGQTIVYCVHDNDRASRHLRLGRRGEEGASGVRHQHRLHRLPAARPLRDRADAGGRDHRARRARGRRLCREVRAAHARRHPRLGRQRPRGRAQVRRRGTALGGQSRPLPHLPAALGARRDHRAIGAAAAPAEPPRGSSSSYSPTGTRSCSRSPPRPSSSGRIGGPRRRRQPVPRRPGVRVRADRGGSGRLPRLARLPWSRRASTPPTARR